MKLKAMLRWYLENTTVSLMIMTGIMLLLWLIRIALYFSLDGMVMYNGLEASIFITLFVHGIVLFSSGFRFGCVNGVSRRTVFRGFICSTAATSSVTALFYTLLLFIDGLIFQDSGSTSLIYKAVSELFGLKGAAAVLPLYLLLSLVFYLLATLLGYPIGGVFYRLGRMGRVLWAAGLPIGVTVILPALIALLPAGIQSQLLSAGMRFLAFLSRSPVNLVLCGAVLSALSAGAGWLLLRRAPLKSAA